MKYLELRKTHFISTINEFHVAYIAGEEDNEGESQPRESSEQSKETGEDGHSHTLFSREE
jgi:hypothetical protein